MPFCTNCGQELDDEAKFCVKCGTTINKNKNAQRETVYDGKIHKCPNCGERLDSFVVVCPACGYELRSTKVSNSVKEFTSKLNEIEATRKCEQPNGLFAKLIAYSQISKTDKEKITFIKSFPVPNSKEDLLEFMILATSHINLNIYSSLIFFYQADKKTNDAWNSKMQQIYEKAKESSGDSNLLNQIESLFNICNNHIKRAKAKKLIKLLLLVLLLCSSIVGIVFGVNHQKSINEKSEIQRLENIVTEVKDALDNGEYKYALTIADSIDYQRFDIEMERKWDIEKEYWVNTVLSAASENGIYLDYKPSVDIDNTKVNKYNTQGKIKIPTANVKDKKYSDIVTLFKNAGFTNITTEKVPDLITGWLHSEGDVIEVVINGSTVLNLFNYYEPDAEIIVRYHGYADKESEAETSGKIQIPTKKVKGEKYSDIVTLFEKAGFTNITTEKVPDLITGWLHSEGDVIEVVINGSTDLDTDKYYDPDAEIIVRYHGYADKESEAEANGRIKIPTKKVKGKKYSDIVTLFEKAGFTNITTEKVPDLITGWLHSEGDVIEVVINGSTDLDTDKYYDSDAEIIIRYHGYSD